MREFFRRLGRKAAPTAFPRLERMLDVDTEQEALVERLRSYELEVARLNRELNGLRRDNRRVAELYDLVFERMQQDNPLIADGDSKSAV